MHPTWVSRLGPQKGKRLLLSGDFLSGKKAVEAYLAIGSASWAELDERFQRLVQHVALLPANQPVLHNILVNQQLYGGVYSTQTRETFVDGISRHRPEGNVFAQRTTQAGWRQPVKERDEPFGDYGKSVFKG